MNVQQQFQQLQANQQQQQVSQLENKTCSLSEKCIITSRCSDAANPKQCIKCYPSRQHAKYVNGCKYAESNGGGQRQRFDDESSEHATKYKFSWYAIQLCEYVDDDE